MIKALFGKFFRKPRLAPPNTPKSYSGELDAGLLERFNKSRPLGPQEKLCWAPFRSIYFGLHGAAVACCYNRQHILGRYPDQSIKEIWFGEAAELLRDKIGQNDLSLGCFGCKTQLEAGNFDAVKAKQYDEVPSNPNRFPSVMEFELSNLCNLECGMCSGDFSSLIRQNRENLPPIEIRYDQKFVDQLDEFIPYLTEVKFYGGEPFLIELYYSIWEKIMAIKPDVRISVQTNATVLNNRVKNILSKTNFHINVSLDSLQKETYESIRTNAKFDRVMENIHWFREYCKEKGTFFGISVCAMRNNWKELPDFVKYCNEMNVPVYFHMVYFPVHLALHTLPAEELDHIAKELKLHDFSGDDPVSSKNKLHYEHFILQVERWRTEALQFFRVSGFQGLKELVLDYIRDNSTQNDEFLKRKSAIDVQFDLLEKRFPNKTEVQERFQKLDLNKGYTIQIIVHLFESSTMEEIYYNFEQLQF